MIHSIQRAFTWEEKIENLAHLAKMAGVYLEALTEEPGTDYCQDARRKLQDAYEQFCQWRHDEPSLVAEIRALLQQELFLDEVTGVRLLVERENPEYPLYTLACPEHHSLSFEEVNAAIDRLWQKARISPVSPHPFVLPPENGRDLLS